MKRWRPLRTLIIVCMTVCLWAAGSGSEFKLFTVYAEALTASDLQELEASVEAALRKRSEVLHFDYTGDKQELSEGIKQTIRQAISRDEYTAYIVDSYFYSIRSWGGSSKVKLSLEYRETLEQTAEVDRQIEQVLGRLIRPGMNEHQKVKAIHDWIVLRLSYDTKLENYTAYSALRTGSAVCQGYSLLAYKMLSAAGVPVRIVEGTVATGEHAWNLVQLDGSWYHLDVTWDDPVPDVLGQVRYDYYLRTDKQMRQDHEWTKGYPASAEPYAEALAGKGSEDPARAAFYDQLEEALSYKWLKPEHTAATSAVLQSRIEQAASEGKTGVKLRYLQGGQLKEDLEAVMMKIPRMASYKAAYSPIGKDGAVLLELSFILHERNSSK
ncbi:transglutaminase [Paenibacillus sambharensis]|uniref:Transglutaminase n=1 Tax=Paenibacillus sambharensis TaxID=1803190 RepID=A0A2W1L9R7_9BACL|nr:transglutaminase domain-containing protein [Paenibacillus sambharensis]PZD95499.1 transglutaminase [Paenibacillus sambharensis]